MNPAIERLGAMLHAAGWQDRVRVEASLAPYTTFNIGGRADLLFEAHSNEELSRACRMAQECAVPTLVLGRGSNVLVADRGVRGLVVVNRAGGWKLDAGGRVTVAGGSALAELARDMAEAGWAGLEWGVGIPGSVGGAIVGNAGAHGGYVGDVLESVLVLDHGEVQRLNRAELGLGYRTSRLKDVPAGNGRPVILEAVFSLRPGEKETLQRQMTEWLHWRSEHQPQEPSAGSVFKRTAQYPAGFLIDQAGLRGRRCGDAQVALKHANFIVNLGGARAEDVRALVEQVREEVEARFGVRLELEIELIGEW